MQSSYSIVPKLQTPRIDPGDGIDIDVYLTGWGPTARNKLGIIHSHPDEWYDTDDPGTLFDRIAEEEGTGNPVSLADEDAAFDMNRVGTFGSFSPGYFSELRDHEPADYELPFIYSETHHATGAPLSVEIKTSDEIKHGDHEIKFVFTYVTDDEVEQDVRTVAFHVRPWWERHRRLLEVIGIGGTVIAFLTFMVTAAMFLVS